MDNELVVRADAGSGNRAKISLWRRWLARMDWSKSLPFDVSPWLVRLCVLIVIGVPVIAVLLALWTVPQSPPGVSGIPLWQQ